jgi:hypothetical protein
VDHHLGEQGEREEHHLDHDNNNIYHHPTGDDRLQHETKMAPMETTGSSRGRRRRRRSLSSLSQLAGGVVMPAFVLPEAAAAGNLVGNEY